MKKTEIISVRLSKEEEEYLKEKAAGFGLSLSRFMRDLAMNYPVTCIVDEKAAHNMLKVAADQGRLGGLFKYWLTMNEDTKIPFSDKRNYDDIDKIVDEILDLQSLIKQEALKIIKAKV
ncbi:plasmid mobilization protein [Sulfurospirillum cavolei]|uniref:plasmid mobilization protein n=1 Tax=Sulfurospirillum cavolei TaxID=366522 RepID=UPI003FA31F55